jgi:TrmH family RNA methyltransferase
MTNSNLRHKANLVDEVAISGSSQSNSGVDEIVTLCKKDKIPFFTSDRFVNELSGKDNAYCISVFRKFDSELDPEANHLLLVSPSDSGNLGSIMRTALAFGLTNIAIIKPCADHFDPKVIRASMGAIFSVKVEVFGTVDDYQEKFKRNLYLLSPDGEAELKDVVFEKPATIVFGGEAAGIPNMIKKKGQLIKISHSKNVDSLNLPIAVGIALYDFSRKE